KLARALSLIPLIVPIAGVIVNLWTHHIFEINAEGLYVRHKWFQFEMAYLVIVSLFFSAPLLGRVEREYEPSRRSHLRLTASFTLCLVLAWLLSHFGERVPVICVCVIVELLCLYVDTSARQISMDKLTQVNNRQNLLGFLEYKLQNHLASMFLLMIDVDYFKDINDTYGHLEGDEALILVSSVLKSACADYHRRPYIARYGGDEFIILLEGTREEADGLCKAINDTLRERCAALNKPYTLTLSIGIGRWSPDMEPKDFIAAADSQLYDIKRARTRPA
ncbi:MAG: GGDEF domain-containing protein, partial [Clostridia bacterium]|nr:GGDEF domain-containing protein [Clostridia bacterium]